MGDDLQMAQEILMYTLELEVDIVLGFLRVLEIKMNHAQTQAQWSDAISSRVFKPPGFYGNQHICP